MSIEKNYFPMTNINIDKDLMDRDLYRIMPLDRFLQMLYTGHNILVHPSAWEDPYEKLISESGWEYKGKKTKFDENPWFGQSWSLNKSDDTMWRAYTNNAKTRAVQIKTTTDKIAAMLSDGKNYNKSVTYYLRKISYCPYDIHNVGEDVHPDYRNNDNLIFIDYVYQYYSKEIEQIVKNQNLVKEEQKALDKSIETLGLCLLTSKRNPFEHENEVRLLAYMPQESTKENYTLHVELDKLIDEVELDPWAPKEFVQPMKEIITNKLPKGIGVKHSNIYETPQYFPLLKIGINK